MYLKVGGEACLELASVYILTKHTHNLPHLSTAHRLPYCRDSPNDLHPEVVVGGVALEQQQVVPVNGRVEHLDSDLLLCEQG